MEERVVFKICNEYNEIIRELLGIINDNISEYVTTAESLASLSEAIINDSKVDNSKADKYLYAADVITSTTHLINTRTKNRILEIFNVNE